MDWFILRIATSERFRAPPNEVRRWSCGDLLEAHAALDAMDVLDRATAEQARRAAGR